MRNLSGTALGDFGLFSAALFLIIPHISDCSSFEQHCSFLVTMVTFLRLKLICGTIIAANIGQGMVNPQLWLSKSSSSHRHVGKRLTSTGIFF